jgi:hypothetical protein
MQSNIVTISECRFGLPVLRYTRKPKNVRGKGRGQIYDELPTSWDRVKLSDSFLLLRHNWADSRANDDSVAL